MPPRRKLTATSIPTTPSALSVNGAITPAPSLNGSTRASRSKSNTTTITTPTIKVDGEVVGNGLAAGTKNGLLTPMTADAGSDDEDLNKLIKHEDDRMDVDAAPTLSRPQAIRRRSSKMILEVEMPFRSRSRSGSQRSKIEKEDDMDMDLPLSRRRVGGVKRAADEPDSDTYLAQIDDEKEAESSDEEILNAKRRKVVGTSKSTPASHSGETTPASRASSIKSKANADVKGKGKGRYVTPSTSLTDEDGHDDDSHSDFEDSDLSDLPPARTTRSTLRTRRTLPAAVADEEEEESKFVSLSDFEDEGSLTSDADEALLLAAAKKASMHALDDGVDGAGPSSGKARNKELEKRARAVERRLGIRKDEPDDSDLPEDGDDEDAETAVLATVARMHHLPTVEEAPDGKVILKNKKGRQLAVLSSAKFMTLQQMRQKRKEDKKRVETEMKPLKDMEKVMKKQLGRKLTWGEKNQIALTLHHPHLRTVWGDIEKDIEIIKPVPMEAHPSLKLTLLPFQKESLYWMKKQEEGVWKGGMLADEMGMGKTIQTIALLLSEPRNKPSLVVAPVVALMQWKHEIETHAEGFTVCLWHGSGRMKAKDLQKFDVVLVSYGTLEASFRKQQRGFKKDNVLIKEKSPMHTFQWHRIILDEAHNIKERSTNAAKAAFALDGKYKWCLSGTPLQNRVGELYSLIRFLGGDPFAYYYCKRCPCKSLHWQFSNKKTCDDCGHSPMQHLCYWNNEILTPIQRYAMSGAGEIAFKKLKILLDRMMLRRTKIERADDLGLPPRTIVVRRDYFSPEEKELYLGLFSQTQRQFSTYVSTGTVLNNYSNIFSLITRMRQMACHPDLVLRSKKSTYVENSSEEMVCRLCNDVAEDAIVSKCNHLFDRACIRDYIETSGNANPDCPVCHVGLSIDLEAEAVDVDEGGKKKGKQGILGRLDLDNWKSSTKLEALVEELTNLRREDSTIKSLVFSQFVSFLDLIAFRLQRAGFVICRLEGGMTPQARDATIQHFMKNTHVTVFLVSLKAGGVALNLTEASRVYLMDSWWNPSVEYQAMDRIHRLGQHRPVIVTKLVVEDSIESKIVQLQEKKMAMTTAALSRDPEESLGKLTPEDLSFLFKL